MLTLADPCNSCKGEYMWVAKDLVTGQGADYRSAQKERRRADRGLTRRILPKGGSRAEAQGEKS
jgi:transposase InsO family protein